MKKKRTILYFILSSLFLCQDVMGQSDLDAIVQSFDHYRLQHFQEKLFIHNDKDFYTAGEIMWFKVYATDAQFNKPLGLSKLCYVELISADHKPVLQAKIELKNGAGNGSFQLPFSFKTGSYVLRSYTQWMKNDKHAVFFEKTIQVVNTLKTPVWQDKDSIAFDVQFFPEGGNLVANIPAKVAFRIVDLQGVSMDANIEVMNDQNRIVSKSSTLRFGMGQFEITPEAGEKYHAVIKMKNGKEVNKQLPPVALTGITMRLSSQDSNQLSLRINSRQAGQVVFLLIHTRNQLKKAVRLELFNSKTELMIDKRELGEGISQFTVFNSAGQPVCERLFFKQPNSLPIDITSDAVSYHTREKVTLDISTVSKNRPLRSDLSMSVYLLDSLQHPGATDILSYLWVESDLKGNIESPDFYFTHHGKELEETADNLMLTQGWRRFKWGDVLKNQTQSDYSLPALEGEIIEGSVVNKINGLTVPDVSATLSVPANKFLFTNGVSNKNGLLRFNLKNVYGANEMVLQTSHSVDSNYRIDLLNPFVEKYTEPVFPHRELSRNDSASILAHSIWTQASIAYTGSAQQQFRYPEGIDTTPFYGIPDKRYYLDDYTRFVTMEEVMREYVSEVRVRKNEGHFSFRVYRPEFQNYFEASPLILLDGVPVANADKIIAMDPLKIKKLDVVSQNFLIHDQVYNGILSFSTYNGDLAGNTLDINSLVIAYKGLQLQREFFSPVYNILKNRNEHIPDFRNLLYWSPNIQTNEKGVQRQSFYTGDIQGKFVIIIQGISEEGLCGSKTAYLTVTK